MGAETPVLITVEHPTTCLSCGTHVAFGEAAWWVKDVGVWHRECTRPRSLAMLVAEAARRRALGL